MPKQSPRGTIRRRSKSRPDCWTVQISLGTDPSTGRRRFRTATVHGSREDAERRRTELLSEKDGGIMIFPTGMTVGRYLEEWLCYGAMRVAARTLMGYREHVLRYITPRIGRVRLDSLTPRHVRDMEAFLLESGGARRQGISPRTVLCRPTGSSPALSARPSSSS